MTALISAAAQRQGIGARNRSRLASCAVGLLACGLIFLMYWPQLQAVWTSGTFFDSDDAMRMVQVRALLAGQPWFDLTAVRLDPPAGVYMHWSRTVDLPVAFVLGLFRLVASGTTADALTRLVVPFLYLAALLAAVSWLAATLLGRYARLPAVAVIVLNGAATVQFEPGRIDHHAPQIVMLVFMVGAAVLALDPARARWSVVAGALAGLSLSASLENLPFIASLVAMSVTAWIWRGAAMALMLRFLSLGLIVGLVPAFAATVAPDRWFDPVCDAFGAAHLGAGLIGAAGCAGLSLASAWLGYPWRRLVGAAAVAALVVAYLAIAYPACLHDPFASVDPLVREFWISKVSESQPLLGIAATTPMTALLYALPVALGLAGCVGAGVVSRGVAAWRFAMVAVLVATGLAMMFWQIRVMTSTMPLAACGALPLATLLRDRWTRQGRTRAAGLASCLVLPFTAFAWAIVLPDDPASSPAKVGCTAASAYTALRTLTPGTVLAAVDAGAFLLAHTELSAYAGPYHRDNDGNRFMIDSFLAKPDAAHRQLAARGVTYVMTCPDFSDAKAFADRAPDGLAAALRDGRIPDWLQAVPLAGTPYAVFRVKPGDPSSSP